MNHAGRKKENLWVNVLLFLLLLLQVIWGSNSHHHHLRNVVVVSVSKSDEWRAAAAGKTMWFSQDSNYDML